MGDLHSDRVIKFGFMSNVTFQLMTAFPFTWEAYIAAYEKRVQVTNLLPALQQQGIQYLLAHLYHIFRACLASGYIHKSWRQVKVTFIPLPEEVNYTEAKTYCSLNLSHSTLKMLQKLEDRNIRDEILRFHPLH
jgi:hypothetical protein